MSPDTEGETMTTDTDHGPYTLTLDDGPDGADTHRAGFPTPAAAFAYGRTLQRNRATRYRMRVTPDRPAVRFNRAVRSTPAPDHGRPLLRFIGPLAADTDTDRRGRRLAPVVLATVAVLVGAAAIVVGIVDAAGLFAAGAVFIGSPVDYAWRRAHVRGDHDSDHGAHVGPAMAYAPDDDDAYTDDMADIARQDATADIIADHPDDGAAVLALSDALDALAATLDDDDDTDDGDSDRYGYAATPYGVVGVTVRPRYRRVGRPVPNVRR